MVYLKNLHWNLLQENAYAHWSRELQIPAQGQISVVGCDAQEFQLNIHLNLLQVDASTYWCRNWQIPAQGQLSLVGSVLKSSNLLFIEICCRQTRPHTNVDIYRFPHIDVCRLMAQYSRVPIESSFKSIACEGVHILMNIFSDSHTLVFVAYLFSAQ